MWLCNAQNHQCENMAPSIPQSLCSGMSSSRNLPQTCAAVAAAHNGYRRPVQRSHQLHNLTILIITLVASWMHLHHFRCFEEHMRMLLQSLRALCKAPGGAQSIREYLEAVVRATRVSGRFAYGFQTELHFADVHWQLPMALYWRLCRMLPRWHTDEFDQW